MIYNGTIGTRESLNRPCSGAKKKGFLQSTRADGRPPTGSSCALAGLSRHFLKGCHQHIDLFFGIVEAEARPDRAVKKPEPFHERLAAVVAGADKDLGGLVQPLGNLVRVETVDRERDHANAVN